jgi:hypothetical protein
MVPFHDQSVQDLARALSDTSRVRVPAAHPPLDEVKHAGNLNKRISSAYYFFLSSQNSAEMIRRGSTKKTYSKAEPQRIITMPESYYHSLTTSKLHLSLCRFTQDGYQCTTKTGAKKNAPPSLSFQAAALRIPNLEGEK